MLFEQALSGMLLRGDPGLHDTLMPDEVGHGAGVGGVIGNSLVYRAIRKRDVISNRSDEGVIRSAGC